MRELNCQAKIVQGARIEGCVAYKVSAGLVGGFPDLFLAHKDHGAFTIECKRRTKPGYTESYKLTTLQRKYLRDHYRLATSSHIYAGVVVCYDVGKSIKVHVIPNGDTLDREHYGTEISRCQLAFARNGTWSGLEIMQVLKDQLSR